MAMTGPDEQYFVYENRLASFKGPQPVTKKRSSNASSRAPKALHWPHKTLAPVDLARAGFVFEPLPQNPDNVVCFLCQKALDGWEEDDSPLDEHLKHSPNCGWAITAAIEAEVGDYGKMHPLDPSMVEARKATFAGKWPYESKKGFKCKTKQLVEAGWKYTPTRESDDMATCTYCQLALDGWESGDKPIDEHYKRSPNCPFFELINQNPPPAKKGGRSKAARGSKASRLSSQSVATAASDLGSTGDITANPDDSVLTTTSVMSKKSTRARKAPASKAKKTRAKKDEAVEILEDEVDHVEAPPPPPPKPSKGRKRGSDEIDDPSATATEAPAPKKRATKGNNADASVLTTASQDVEMLDAGQAPQPASKKNARTRKASQTSVRSQASTASLRAKLTEDDELERRLQVDLDTPLTDDDLAVDSDSERKKAPAKGRPRKGTTTRKASAQKQKEQAQDFAMFDPTPVQHDEADVDAELKALEAEVEAESQAMETLEVPKKGRKAGTRKASKQTKKAKDLRSDPADESMLDSAPVSEPAPAPETVPDAEPLEDDLEMSTATIITNTAPRESLGKRPRGRPSKKSTSSLPRQSQGAAEEAKRLSSAPPAHAEVEILTASVRESFSALNRTPGKVVKHQPRPAPASSSAAATPNAAQVDKALPPPPESETPAHPPATPRAHATPSAKQAAISPSQSPQSSDAENQPPSSKPATSVPAKRVVLAAVAATPARGSPSKRNVIAGLQSTKPWTAVDLDLVFSPGEGKENGIDKLLRRGVDLTSPEKRMTVEEWIFHNASQAEQKLKSECEAMISSFEKEGTRAMTVLEGLIVD